MNSIRAALLAAAVALLPAATHAQAIQAWVQRYDELITGSDPYRIAMAVDTNGDVCVTTTSGVVNTYYNFLTVKYSSTGMPMWTNVYGEDNKYDMASAVAIDTSGNVIVAGRSTDLINFPNADLATVKYSSAGVPSWTNRYSQAYGADALAADLSGNVVVAGSGPSGFCTLKYSSAGALLWAHAGLAFPYSTSSESSVAVDGSGNLVVTGNSQGGSPMSEDFVTVKYSSAGTPLWTRRYNGPGNSSDRYTHVAVDAGGNVVVTGQSASINAYPYNFDFATIKYSSAGVPLWTNRYNGPGNDDDGGGAVAIDTSGNVVVTGQSYGGASSYDFATIKYSSVGEPLWTNRYSGPGNSYDNPTAMAVDRNGNVYVTGTSPGSGSSWDFATVAYSSAGVPLWTNRYNGPANYGDSPSALVLDANGNVYVTGPSATTDTWPYGYGIATVKYVIPPIVTRQPLSRTNVGGTTASFNVEVAGSAPFSYQWRRQGTNLVDGGNISGVTTTNLTIANVQPGDAAGYSVVVTNAYGVTTSIAAQLTVAIPPSPGRFTNFKYSLDTGFSLIFRDGTVGQPYRIQRSSSLVEDSWTDWQSFTYTEPVGLIDVGANGAERRYYRAISP